MSDETVSAEPLWPGGTSYVPMPDGCFLNDLESIGARNGRKTYRDRDGNLYQWDERHGEVEVYNKRGRHTGVVDSNNRFAKDAVKGRKIDV